MDGKKKSFSLPMLIPFIDSKLHKIFSDKEWIVFVLIHSVQTQWRSYNAHKCRKWQKSETIF